jgi:quercetin dioxygenase-like cupin family protein
MPGNAADLLSTTSNFNQGAQAMMPLQKPQLTARAYVTCVFGVPEREVVQAQVELAAGVTLDRHRHSGDQMVYVLEGALEYQLEGQPPVTLNAGDVLFIPAGTMHTAKNAGSGNGSET